MACESKIPRHVAIIMDGNGRWAQKRGKDRVEGHVAGVESVRRVVESAVRHGVKYLTLYVFSQENWGRPPEEVDALMELLCQCVEEQTDQLVEQGVRVKIIGERSALPDAVGERLVEIESKTADCKTITVLLALNYSSRVEIVQGVKKIVDAAQKDGINTEDITTELLSNSLYTGCYPDPDLLIRTGGDCRLSNFMLWQAAYAELYFTPEYWPDFDEASFDRAVEAFGVRERRYGLISKQLEPK